jgi:hypothetical protein
MFKAPPDLRAGRMLGMQPELLCPRRSRFAPILRNQSLNLMAQSSKGEELSVEAKKPIWLFQRALHIENMGFQAVCQGNGIQQKAKMDHTGNVNRHF